MKKSFITSGPDLTLRDFVIHTWNRTTRGSSDIPRRPRCRKIIYAIFTQTSQRSVKVVAFEPPRGKTNIVVSKQVRHKLTCTVTEKS